MRFSFRSKPLGWRYESHRHSLAARGIRTNFAEVQTKFSNNMQKTQVELARNQAQQLNLAKAGLEAPKQIERGQQKEKTFATAPVPTKLQAADLASMAAEKITLRPSTDFLGRLTGGNFDYNQREAYLAAAGGDMSRAKQLSNAAYEGARANIMRGLAPDPTTLSDFGLSSIQIRQLQSEFVNKYGLSNVPANLQYKYAGLEAQRALSKTGAVVQEVGVRAIGEIEGGAEAEFQARMQEGARRFEQAPDQLELLGEQSSAFGPVNRGQAKWRVGPEGEEIIDSPGMLNPLEIGGLNEHIKKKEKERQIIDKRLKSSEKVDMMATDIFNGKEDLSKADFTGFKEGLKAYKRGDREALMKSIVDLESENVALKHKMSLVDNIRMQILSSQNMSDALTRGRENQGGFFFNPLVAPSSGSAVYSRQTEKAIKTGREIQKSSNAVSQRIAELKRKLNRLNSMATLDDAAPEQPVKTFSDNNSMVDLDFDQGHGLLKHDNVVAKNTFNVAKGKTNILFNENLIKKDNNEMEENQNERNEI